MPNTTRKYGDFRPPSMVGWDDEWDRIRFKILGWIERGQL